MLTNEDEFDKENKSDDTEAIDGYRTDVPPDSIDDSD